MGYYLQTPGQTHGKAEALAYRLGGRIVGRDEAELAVTSREHGVVVVILQIAFEAAGFAYDASEWRALTSDGRLKKYVIITRDQAETESGYKVTMNRRAEMAAHTTSDGACPGPH